MHLFIDESGDTGCVKSATKYFVISITYFKSVEDMQDTELAIKDFKRRENLNSELHFCKTQNSMRDKFFEEAKNFPFFAEAIYVNKGILYSEFLKNNSDKLYNYILKWVLERFSEYDDLHIILDGKGNKTLEKELKSYIKSNPKIKVKKIKMQDSKKDTLLQLADMVASSIGHSLNRSDKKDADKWKNTIKNKINLREFV